MELKNKNLFLIIFASITCAFILTSFSTQEVFGVTCPESEDGTGWDSSTGVCIPTETGLPNAGGSESPISTIIENFMQWLLGILGFLAIVAFTISGIQYLTAAGNEDQISTAKRNMTWSIVGVVVALMGFIIIIAIDTWLSGFSTTF
jgi:hypothetical protein